MSDHPRNAAEQREDELEGRRLAARSDAAGWRSLCEAAQADKDRLQRELEQEENRWHETEHLRIVALQERDRLQRENVLVKAQAEGAESMFNELRQERDRLQRELDREKRHNTECEAENDHLRQLHDALRGLYKLVDRHGWISGLSKETRDVVLAKARDALKDA